MFQFLRIFPVGLLVLSLLLSNGAVALGADTGVPVIIGGEEDMDACMSIGAVSGLNPKGDGFLAVRSGPGVSYTLLDKLKESEEVYVCSGSKDNRWMGIVYSNSKSVSIYDCGVSSPVDHARPYKGKCRSGWVRAKWVKVIAE